MENEVAVVGDVRYDLSVSRAPKQVLAEAQDAAKALQSIISQRKNAVKFNGKQYLQFEDYQTCGKFYGVTAKIISTEYIEINGAKGFLARAEAINSQNGQVVSAAESMCMNDEKNWESKPLFQLRSMAQTRACAKSLRNCLAWVVVLAGYEPSVAEEMTGDETGHAAAERAPIEQSKPKPAESGEVATFVPVDVQIKHGEGAKGPWTKYGIKAPDGRIFGTFREEIGNAAQDAASAKTPITLGYKMDASGKYFNVVSIA